MPDITIDWLSFKIKNFVSDSSFYFVKKLEDILLENGFDFEAKVTNQYKGYNSRYYSGVGISLFIDYPLDKKELEYNELDEEVFYKVNCIFVQISGTACNFINDYYPGGIIVFCKEAFNNNAMFSRLDLAADDRDNNYLDIDKINRCISTGMWRGSANKITPVLSYKKDGSRDNGCTFYIGSRNSDSMIRIYDKAAQLELTEHWVRCELELHNKYADDITYLICSKKESEINDIYNSLCYDRIRFLSKKDENRNNEYDKVCKWWLKFLENCRIGMKLTRGDMKDIESKYRWYTKICTPTRSMLVQTVGIDKVEEAESAAYKRLTKRQQILIREFDAEINRLKLYDE